MHYIKSRKRYLVWALFFIMLTSGCQDEKMVQTEIYFGLSIKDTPITSEQWESFRIKTLDNSFSGYTEFDCKGYWKSPSGQSLHENSKMITYIHNGSPAENNKIDSVISVYKTRFKQESVLKVNNRVNVYFK